MSDTIKVRPEGVMTTQDGENIITLHHIVGEDGLSYKERNLQTKHSIPLYSLVRLKSDPEYPDVMDGVCLFVQSQTRDCDGTPLYMLTSKLKTVGKDMSIKAINERNRHCEYSRMFEIMDSGSLVGAYSEASLEVVKSADEIKAMLKKSGQLEE